MPQPIGKIHIVAPRHTQTELVAAAYKRISGGQELSFVNYQAQLDSYSLPSTVRNVVIRALEKPDDLVLFDNAGFPVLDMLWLRETLLAHGNGNLDLDRIIPLTS